MAAQGARSGCHESVLDDALERYGPLEVDAFIDLQFRNALRGEEELYSSNQGEGQVIGSKLEVENVEEDGPLATLESFTYGNDTQINLDDTISLASPQEELESDVVCPCCRRVWEKDGLVDCRTFCSDNKVNKKTTTPLTSQEKTSGCDGGIEMREETIDPRKSVVTELQLSDISDDVGTCWRELGPKLKVAASKIRNLDEEYNHNRDKANSLLIIWKEQVGSGALAGHLADSLERIGRKSIAEKLLGVSDVKLPACTSLSEGHKISLTVKCDLDAELDNKLMLCEDDYGNKYMLKAVSSNVGCWNSEEIQKNKRFLESVAVAAQDMGKTAEQRRQESLKRISSEVQELRQQLKRVKLDCGDADLDTSDGVKSCPQGDLQSMKKTVDDNHITSVSEHSSQGESVQQLLKSCEDQRMFCEGIYGALIKLVGEVGQPREDNAKCIRQLCDFIKELQDQEKTFFSKIEQVRSQSQLNDLQLAQVASLDKWKRAQKQQVEGVEKLLLLLLNQGKMERRESHGKMEKSQKQLNRRSEPIKSTTTSSGFGRRRTKTDPSKNCSKSQSDISSPVCVHRMLVMDTNKKLKKEKKDSP